MGSRSSVLARGQQRPEQATTTKDGLLTDLRARLLDRSLPMDCRQDADPIRQAAWAIGRTAALNLDNLWPASRQSQEGPIDVIDLFSGCGGMSAGFMALNAILPAFKLAGAADIDRVANASYAMNLALEPDALDVAKLARSSTLRKRLTERRRARHPLVLIGCAPCQGFSSHRNAAGALDPRNSLFLDFAKIAADIKPDVLVAENVPELLTDRYWPLVIEAKRILSRAGYRVQIVPHNLAGFGVPQERFRVLLLAMRRKFRAPEAFLGRESFRTVRDAIGHLPRISAGERHTEDPLHYTAGHQESTLCTIRAVPKDGGNRPADVGPPCLRRAKERQGRSAYDDVYGRLFWDRPAITITAYARNPASGRYVHPEQDRGLSVREAALLQSFPAAYRLTGSLDERFRQIGNAVPPAFSAFVAAHVLGELAGPAIAGNFREGLLRPVGSSFSRIIPALKHGHLAAVS
jgi:DNA (cytosine-5)-methyltransferase 1